MKWVWNAPATLSGMTRARAGGSAAKAASASRAPAATTCPAPLTLAGVRSCRSMAASTSSGSPPSTALMPVGVAALACGHRPAALGDEAHGVGLGEHPGRGGGGDLADRVPGERPGAGRRPGVPPSAVLPDRARRASSPAPDEQRLGDRGVLDGVLVGRGAVGDEVDLGGVGERGQLVTQAGQLEPRGEEARGLGALAGADDDDHVFHPVLPTVTIS